LIFFDVFWLSAGILIFVREERRVLKKGTLGYY